MDRTLMEKPESKDRNFSIIVTNAMYLNLRKIAVIADMSLGGVCREVLQIVNQTLYSKLHTIARSRGITVGALAREVLDAYVNSKR